MRIGLTSIFVDDQDRAEKFYTELLGLEVKTDAPYGPRRAVANRGLPRRP